MSKVSAVMSLWTVTRLTWGIATLLVYQYKIELLQDSHTPVWSFLVLLLMFLVCEILPIVALLDYSYLSMIGIELVEIWSTDGGTTRNNDLGQSTLNTASTSTNGSIDGGFDEERSVSSAQVRMGPLLAAVMPTPPRRRVVRWQDESSSTQPLLDESRSQPNQILENTAPTSDSDQDQDTSIQTA